MMDVMIPILISAFAFIGLIFAKKIAEKKIDDIVKEGKPNKIVLPLVIIIVAGLVYAGFNYYIKTFDPPAGGFEVTLVYKPIETKQPEIAVQTVAPMQETAVPILTQTEESTATSMVTLTETSTVTQIPTVLPTVMLTATPNVTSKSKLYTGDPTSVGTIVTYGYYEQDNVSENGKEPIEWIVLKYDRENGRSLLLSKYGLDAHRFDRSEYRGWEKSEVHDWLNSTFLGEAFSSEEQKAIITTTVRTPSYGYFTDNSISEDAIWLLDRE